MKSSVFWAAWALVPVGVLAIHMGIGREYARSEIASTHLRAAMAAEVAEDWATAAEEYAQAESLIEKERIVDRRAIGLARAKARMLAGEYIEGQEQLDQLLAEALERTPGDEEFISLMRTEVASAAYYASWAMRLEGAQEDEWLPESEIARQQYRLLTETAQGRAGESNAEPFDQNLEAVVRFQRMTIEEVRAMGMPKKCNGGGMCNSKKKQRQSQCKSPGQPKDAREQIKSAGGAGNRGTGW